MAQSNKPKIATPHPEHSAMQPHWKKLRTTAAGADAVKAGGYLVRPNGLDLDAFVSYIQRADFYPAVGRALEGLAGSLFQKKPEVIYPGDQAHLLDIDMANRPIDTVALAMTREALLVGRYALVIDMSDEGRPVLLRYNAEDLVSWWAERRGGDEVTNRAVFKENALSLQDDGVIKSQVHYREYFLSDEGNASVRLWKPVAKANLADPYSGAKYAPEEVITLNRHGQPLTFLPIVIGGAMSLGVDVEQPPLLPLADASLSHFQVSADYKHSLHFVACPTIIVAGSPQTDGAPLKVGSSVAWNLQQGATWGLIGAEAKNVAPLRDYLMDKEREFVALSSRILEAAPRVMETATGVAVRVGGEHSVLRATAGTINQAMSAALRIMGWWQSGAAKPSDVKATYRLDTDCLSFAGSREDIVAWTTALMAGGMSKHSFAYNISRAGLLPDDITPEEEVARIAQEEADEEYSLDKLVRNGRPGEED